MTVTCMQAFLRVYCSISPLNPCYLVYRSCDIPQPEFCMTSNAVPSCQRTARSFRAWPGAWLAVFALSDGSTSVNDTKQLLAHCINTPFSY